MACENCGELREIMETLKGTFDAYFGFTWVDDSWKIAACVMPTELDQRHKLATLIRQVADDLDNDTPVPAQINLEGSEPDHSTCVE